MSEVKVRGLAELNRFLQHLPAKMEANVLRGALREGARVVEAAAKANVPVDTGRLRDSIRVKAMLRKGRVIASVTAGGRSGKKKVLTSRSGRLRAGYEMAFYARWVEYGVAAHKIIPRKAGGFLSFGDVFARSVEHPGFSPKPFMRPALNSNAQEATMAAARYIKRRLATKHGLDTSGVEVESQ